MNGASAPTANALPVSAGASDAAPVVARLRPLPYPYQAMLAICSDLDETPDAGVYAQIQTYLNTTRSTRMGPGVGLEVGNTIYFDMPSDQFAYWNTDDRGRAMVRALIRSGHVDCLHSFGDLATTREHAIRALDELARHDCRIEVWVDHAVAPTNLGADIMHGTGDVPGSPAYHTDRTVAFGVQYVWRGRVTSVIGQNRPRSLRGVFRATHPLASARTLAKECAKGWLARRGDAKYAMHGPNEILRSVQLRDGQQVCEFLRCNPYWGGVEHSDTAAGFAEVLTRRFLDRLIERRGVCILYTHLGKIRRSEEPFEAPTRQAFETLAESARRQRILVTTTRRLLGYVGTIDRLCASVRRNGNGMIVDLNGPTPAKPAALAGGTDLDGVTVYLDGPGRPVRGDGGGGCDGGSTTDQSDGVNWERVAREGGVVLRMNGQRWSEAQVNPPDETGRPSVSVPWQWLEFPEF